MKRYRELTGADVAEAQRAIERTPSPMAESLR